MGAGVRYEDGTSASSSERPRTGDVMGEAPLSSLQRQAGGWVFRGLLAGLKERCRLTSDVLRGNPLSRGGEGGLEGRNAGCRCNCET